MFSFRSSSVVSKVSVADFEHLFFCWEKYFKIRKTIVVALILKELTQQTNTYSKSATEILKQDMISVKVNSRDCAFLLTTFNMSNTCSSVFLAYYNISLFTVMLYVYDFFFDVFMINFKQFHVLIYFFCHHL